MASFQRRGTRWRAIVRKTGHPSQSKTFSTKVLPQHGLSRQRGTPELASRSAPTQEACFQHDLGSIEQRERMG